MDRDALLELTIAEDAMTAFGTFLPPEGSGRMLTPDYVETVLESRGVIAGIREEEIAELILSINTERRIREGVVLAQGTPPRPGRPAFYRVLGQDKHPHDFELTDDRIDHKNVTRLPVVHKGQVIAKLVPLREGIPGVTVRGDELPPPVESVEQLQPGKNTRIVEDHVVAEVGGQLQTKNGEFFVEDRLEITGSIGYGTGSIEFPGDVVLRGEVKDGFHIWAGGTLEAAGTVDVSEIYCLGDVMSTGGLVGRGKGLLRSGGKVQARFVGNCTVESKSSVFVKQYIYHSTVGCIDRLAMGDKGRIIGGVLTAVNGVRVNTLGNCAGVPTNVRVGIDFIAERKLKLVQEKHKALTLKLQKLLAAMGDNPSDRQVDIVHKIEESRMKLTMQLGEFAESLDRNEEAEVIVDGSVFPGVQVQICRASYRVETVMNKVRFRLEKMTGRVVPVPLSSGKETA